MGCLWSALQYVANWITVTVEQEGLRALLIYGVNTREWHLNKSKYYGIQLVTKN